MPRKVIYSQIPGIRAWAPWGTGSISPHERKEYSIPENEKSTTKALREESMECSRKWRWHCIGDGNLEQDEAREALSNYHAGPCRPFVGFWIFILKAERSH